MNVPLEPETGEGAWLAAVQVLLPELAAAFGPDLIVSQHGADSHAWDPLAHLRVTTTAMGEAARLVDRVAHRLRRRPLAGDRRRRVRRVPGRAPDLEPGLAGRGASRGPGVDARGWRERWAAEAARYGQAPLPATFEDAPNAGVEMDASQAMAEPRGLETVGIVRRLVVPRLAPGGAGSRLVGSARVELGRGIWRRPRRRRAGAGRRSSIPTLRRGSGSLAPRVVAPVRRGCGARPRPCGHRAMARA